MGMAVPFAPLAWCGDYGGGSLLKREPPPYPLKRNVGAFRFAPTPPKRPDQGGLRAPLFWTSPPRENANSTLALLCTGAAAAGGRRTDLSSTTPIIACIFKCGGALLRLPIEDAAGRGFESHTAAIQDRQRIPAGRPVPPADSGFFSTGRGGEVNCPVGAREAPLEGFSLPGQRKAGAQKSAPPPAQKLLHHGNGAISAAACCKSCPLKWRMPALFYNKVTRP